MSSTHVHPVVSRLRSLFEQHEIWKEEFFHAPVVTSHEAAQIRSGGYTLAQGAKALILKVYKTKRDARFVMVVLSGDSQFQSKKLRQLLDIKKIRFVTEDELSEITGGILRGGVPPFGSLFNLETYVDDSVLNQEKIIFNAGDRSVSMAIKLEDYLAIEKPIKASIC